MMEHLAAARPHWADGGQAPATRVGWRIWRGRMTSRWECSTLRFRLTPPAVTPRRRRERWRRSQRWGWRLPDFPGVGNL